MYLIKKNRQKILAQVVTFNFKTFIHIVDKRLFCPSIPMFFP